MYPNIAPRACSACLWWNVSTVCVGQDGGTQKGTCCKVKKKKKVDLMRGHASLLSHLHTWICRYAKSQTHQRLTYFIIFIYHTKNIHMSYKVFVLTIHKTKTCKFTPLHNKNTHTFHPRHMRKHSRPQHTYHNRGFYDRAGWHEVRWMNSLIAPGGRGEKDRP